MEVAPSTAPRLQQIDETKLTEEFDDFDPNSFDDVLGVKGSTASKRKLYNNPNGYTSEESGYSSGTSDMIDSSPLPKRDSIKKTKSAKKQRNINAGQMIEGKTSRYRGVTRTSKSGWGAKFSQKRITNTCKTEEEAAHVYDKYLKENHPEKYKKYANFCPRCDKFTNSLGLKWANKECICSSEDIKTAEQRPETEVPMGGSDQVVGFTAQPIKIVKTTNQKTAEFGHDYDSTLQDEFDFEPYPLQSNPAYCSPATMAISPTSFGYSSTTPAFINTNADFLPPEQMEPIRHSLELFDASYAPGDISSSVSTGPTMTYIPSTSPLSAATQGFSTQVNNNQEMGYSTFISRTSSTNSLTNIEPINCYSELNSAPRLTKQNSLEMDISSAPMTAYFDEVSTQPPVNTDYSVNQPRRMNSFEEVCFVVDNMMVPQSNSNSAGYDETIYRSASELKNIMASGNDSIVTKEDLNVKRESIQDYLYGGNPAACNVGMMLKFKTNFLTKYWRNDRKNIQCFPFCREFGDYLRMKQENLQHENKSVCREEIVVEVANAPAFQSYFSVGKISSVDKVLDDIARKQKENSVQPCFLSRDEVLHENKNTCFVVGTPKKNTSKNSNVQEIVFRSDVWKFEGELSKKRTNSGPKSGSGGKGYCFHVDIYAMVGDNSEENNLQYQYVSSISSGGFELESTRTLLRHKTKRAAVSETETSDENVNCFVPKKIRVRGKLDQHGNNITEFDDDDAELVERDVKSEYSDDEESIAENAEELNTHDEDDDIMDQKLSFVEKKSKKTKKEYEAPDVGAAIEEVVTKKQVDPIVDCNTKPRDETTVEPANHGKDRSYHQVETPTQSRVDVAPPRTVVEMEAGQSSPTAPEYDMGSMLPSFFSYAVLNFLFGFATSPFILVGSIISVVLFPVCLRPFFCFLDDSIADKELYRANSSYKATCPPIDRVPRNEIGLGNSKVWSRIFYLSLGRLIVAAPVLVIHTVLAVLGGLFHLLRVQAVSRPLLGMGNGLVMSSIFWTKSTFGKTD